MGSYKCGFQAAGLNRYTDRTGSKRVEARTGANWDGSKYLKDLMQQTLPANRSYSTTLIILSPYGAFQG